MSATVKPANRLVQRLLDHFEERPQATFCRLIGNSGETVLTWSELGQSSLRFAHAYQSSGLAVGDDVLIFLRHRPELYGSLFGAMLAGLVPSYMPCTSPKQDPAIYWTSHQQLLDRTRPAAIVADHETFREMDAAGLRLDHIRRIAVEELPAATGRPVPLAEDAVALLQHSSGTTGLKKGVALSYRAIVDQIESYASAIDATPADVIVSWLPLYHDMGLMACCILPAYLGLPIVHIDPFTWLAQPALLFDALVAHRGTLAWLPNFAFEHMASVTGRRAAEYDLSGVRAFINCSEPCKAASFDRFRMAFAASGVRQDQLQCCYAMAETVFAVTQTKPGSPVQRLRLESQSLQRGQAVRLAQDGAAAVELIETGLPIPGIDVTAYDEQRRPLSDGEVGELGIRAPFLFSGYNKDPGRTAERLVDGTYFTRDLGFVRDRHVYVLGRVDDLIIVNGRNLYAHEVEAVIGDIAGLKRGRSVAIAQFNARAGSEALVVISERHLGQERPEAELRRDILRAVYSTFEVTPWRVHIVDEGWLIKTTSGKISRTENLARLQRTAEEQ
jgi:acyl-CoA synthetase (AMP-forming)/AMP-acid ligase II